MIVASLSRDLCGFAVEVTEDGLPIPCPPGNEDPLIR